MPGLLTVTVKQARRLVVAVVGSPCCSSSVAMIVLPGPAVVVIPLGLAVLATEFVWARNLLKRIKSEAQRLMPKGPQKPQ